MTDKTWEQMLEGEWMLKFYAPWCPACRAMESAWIEFSKWAASEGREVKVGSVDVTDQPALNGRFMITSLPTIYHVKNGEFRQYTSSRDLPELKNFLSEQEWKELSPVSSWTSPTSLIMTTMSRLFSFSMELKGYHSTLNSDYGFPTWLSMLLFALLIITVGLLLGMVLVFATDYIWGPPDYYTPPQTSVRHKKDDDAPITSAEGKEELKGELEKEEKSESEVKCDDTDSELRQRKVNTEVTDERPNTEAS